MTDEAKRLIKAMRTRCAEQGDCNNCPKWDYCIVNGDHVMHNKAADLIESLAAELEQVKQERDGLSIMLTAAQSAAETFKRERDAAVEELDHFCDNCKYVDNAYGEYPCPSRADYDHCDSCPGWQWRGVKED